MSIWLCRDCGTLSAPKFPGSCSSCGSCVVGRLSEEEYNTKINVYQKSTIDNNNNLKRDGDMKDNEKIKL